MTKTIITMGIKEYVFIGDDYGTLRFPKPVDDHKPRNEQMFYKHVNEIADSVHAKKRDPQDLADFYAEWSGMSLGGFMELHLLWTLPVKMPKDLADIYMSHYDNVEVHESHFEH